MSEGTDFNRKSHRAQCEADFESEVNHNSADSLLSLRSGVEGVFFASILNHSLHIGTNQNYICNLHIKDEYFDL